MAEQESGQLLRSVQGLDLACLKELVELVPVQLLCLESLKVLQVELALLLQVFLFVEPVLLLLAEQVLLRAFLFSEPALLKALLLVELA